MTIGSVLGMEHGAPSEIALVAIMPQGGAMESLFPGSYRASAKDLEQLAQEATIAFDSNVLLHIYRYSPAAVEQLLTAMEKVADRLWIPYQAAKEFHRNREQVINDQPKAVSSIQKAFDTALAEVRRHGQHHPTINLAGLEEIAKGAVDEVRAVLADAGRGFTSVTDDPFLRRFTAIVGDRVGKEPEASWLKARYEEARDRYSQKVPPGYKDDAKPEPDKWGDFVLWRELLDHAGATKRPIILVTDDAKEDWWLEQHGDRVGPRRELIDEMGRAGGVAFHLYAPDQFVAYAQQHLGVDENQGVIEEVREVSRDASIQIDALMASLDAGIRADLQNANRDNRPFYAPRLTAFQDYLAREGVSDAITASWPQNVAHALQATGTTVTLEALQRSLAGINEAIVGNAMWDVVRPAVQPPTTDWNAFYRDYLTSRGLALGGTTPLRRAGPGEVEDSHLADID